MVWLTALSTDSLNRIFQVQFTVVWCGSVRVVRLSEVLMRFVADYCAVRCGPIRLSAVLRDVLR